jgi:hypothetical protein
MNPNEPLSIFFTWGVRIGKPFTLMVIIQGLLQNIKFQTKQRFRSIKINSFKNGRHKKICI